jgi:uroporphyrinogen-III decarboxylase
MTSRERILAALNRRQPDRVPMWETQFWPETIERWQDEGFPAGVDPVRHFGLDTLTCVNALFDPSLQLEPRTIEQTAEYRIGVDGYGKTIKEWLHSYNPPSILAPGVRDREDWCRVRSALTASEAKFNNAAAEREYARARQAGEFLAITPAEPMWFVIHLTMGYEHGLKMVARDPALVAEMVAEYTDYLLAMLAMTFERGHAFDAMWFWSDLCYRGGLLFSPRAARDLVLPHWKRLGDFAHRHGMRFVFHCDGNVADLLPLLIEAGCDAIHPLEARAGNDVREYKRLYGDRMCLIGNIDADVIATNDRQRIEREVAGKVPVAAAGGGYIYHIDHSVPPTVSLESYRWLLECVRRYGAAHVPARPD